MASSGNFCILNPLAQFGGSTDASTRRNSMSDGNLKYVNLTGNTAVGNIGVTSGKWYYEVYISSFNADNGMAIGWANDVSNLDAELGYNTPSQSSGAQAFGLYMQNQKLIYGPGDGGSSYNKTYGSGTPTDGDIIRIWLDADNGRFWAGLNGTIWGSGDPSAGSNWGFGTGGSPHNIAMTTRTLFPAIGNWSAADATVIFNFGQDSTFQGAVSAGGNADGNGFGDFKYDPDGFLALCSANLPLSSDLDPAETDDDYAGTKQFNAIKYVGNDGTNNITYGFKPDLVWGKDLDGIGGGYSPHVWDTTRGDDYYMYSNGTAASTTSGSDYLEFTSTGIKLDNSWDGINHSGANYISFGWRANGGTTSTNNEGNHTSTVQANTVGGFSIISYANYTSASGVTVGHGLTQAPDLYIHKSTANTSNWNVYHHSLGATKALVMNSLAGEATAVGYWANTEPTSTVLSLGNGFAGTGAGIVYAWHEVPGLSKFGKYNGSGTSDGTYIELGFRPKMLWIKRSSSSSITYGWNCFIDTINDNVNKAQFKGWWLDQYVGASSNYPVDFLSTGFKHRNNNANLDSTGEAFVYMAWADTPAKYSVAF